MNTQEHARQAIAARARTRLLSALGKGPTAFAELDTATRISKLRTDSLRWVAREYDPVIHGGRIICGPTNRGKTMAAVELLYRWHCVPDAIRRMRDPHSSPRETVAWVRAFDLPNARLQTGLGEGEADLVAIAKAVNFLVLDDLAWESQRAGAADVVSELIAERYDAGRITLVTSGQRSEELENRYGAAVTRRVCEAGGKPGKVIDLWPAN